MSRDGKKHMHGDYENDIKYTAAWSSFLTHIDKGFDDAVPKVGKAIYATRLLI